MTPLLVTTLAVALALTLAACVNLARALAASDQLITTQRRRIAILEAHVVDQQARISERQAELERLASESVEYARIFEIMQRYTRREAFIYTLYSQPTMDGPQLLAAKGRISAN